MANYEINLTATQIESALNKAHAPATVVDNTQNLVESGAIKTYVDTQVSAGASITTASFAGSALEDSNDGITATDDAIPTSKAVKNYADKRKLKTGWTDVSIPTNGLVGGTATKDMFFIANLDTRQDGGTLTHYIGGSTAPYEILNLRMDQDSGNETTMYMPVAAGELWYFYFAGGEGQELKYKELTL